MPGNTVLRLALLVCDTPAENIQKKYGAYPELYTKAFQDACPSSLKVEWEYFDVTKQEYPDLPDIVEGKYDGLVLTGSKASAYEEEPWILKLIEFVKTVRAAPRVKLVGICFGHQIISIASGGRCVKNANGWEFGYTDVQLTDLGKQFYKTSKSSITFAVFTDGQIQGLHQVHQDHVPDLPPNFHSLATTAPHTPIHSLVSDDNRCLTLQGHPEFSRELTRDLLEMRRDSGVVPREYANAQLAILAKESVVADNNWTLVKIFEFLQGDLKLEDDSVTPDTGNAHGPNVKIGYD
ncbi:hypothetical protein EC973_001356 [Apophysomyces ossiformis]|uniref:Glutamine amidotransferase domain-containing protein n=1 Tax=Apophysomyces ossiformis TaxID=679940 RepID=A0A8H7BY71_9FUNG|nr:hypothetical protein EC973_001356 [Apophysomyces ossiformis]